MQNARENPLAAAAAAAAVSGAPPPQTNAENLLDIDFDGSAPASAQKEPIAGMSGLEGLAGTPQRVQSPSTAGDPNKSAGGMGGLDDLMGLSAGGGADLMGGANDLQMNGSAVPGGSGGMTNADILGGFASMDMGATTQPAPAGQQLGDNNANTGNKKTNEDLLGLF